jgi:DNA-binding HxlR family transcriptional regulator
MPKKKPEAARRSDCPIAGALDILGDRWSLLILRDVVFRSFREYGHFLAAGEGISTNILAERLDRLTCAGLLVRQEHPTDGKKFLYRLSEKGVDLVPTLIELALWGAKYVPNNAAPAEVVHQMRTAREQMIEQLRGALLAELRDPAKAGPAGIVPAASASAAARDSGPKTKRVKKDHRASKSTRTRFAVAAEDVPRLLRTSRA